MTWLWGAPSVKVFKDKKKLSIFVLLLLLVVYFHDSTLKRRPVELDSLWASFLLLRYSSRAAPAHFDSSPCTELGVHVMVCQGLRCTSLNTWDMPIYITCSSKSTHWQACLSWASVIRETDSLISFPFYRERSQERQQIVCTFEWSLLALCIGVFQASLTLYS